MTNALRNIDQPRYLHWSDADAYADAIEGALYLLNRFPVRDGFDWMERMSPLFLGKQRDNGIVEGWYGDGNYARTALLAARYYTQGTVCRPWRTDLRCGAMREGGTLRIALRAERDWEGKIIFDQPRHRLILNLPTNYARLNEWSEWFTIENDGRYQVKASDARSAVRTGAELAQGLPLTLKAGKVTRLEIRSQ